MRGHHRILALGQAGLFAHERRVLPVRPLQLAIDLDPGAVLQHPLGVVRLDGCRPDANALRRYAAAYVVKGQPALVDAELDEGVQRHLRARVPPIQPIPNSNRMIAGKLKVGIGRFEGARQSGGTPTVHVGGGGAAGVVHVPR